MTYSGTQLLWLFLCYSFLGWVLETATAAVRKKRFVNRGMVNGPFCVIYGIAAALITATTGELHGFWLFLDCVILATVIEWVAGHLIERWYRERWWNYENIRWNLDGYISLPTVRDAAVSAGTPYCLYSDGADCSGYHRYGGRSFRTESQRRTVESN